MPDLILLLGDTGMPERDSPNALRVTEESKDIPIQASATIEHDWQFPTTDVSNGSSSHRSASWY